MNRPMPRRLTACLYLLAVAIVSGCAHSPPSDPWDPIEPVNRAVYQFNETADRYVLRPVARGYDRVTPAAVQRSVTNFFDNLHEPINAANSALQLKFEPFNVALGRFMINSTAGVFGLFDVASGVGVPEVDEDLGQTLGYWGVGQGPYLMLPFLGPTTGRDFSGSLGDQFLYPPTYLTEYDDDYIWIELGLRGLEVLNERASLLGFEQTLEQQFDPYAFLRGYYLENRLELVYDGNVPRERLEPADVGTDADDTGDSP